MYSPGLEHPPGLALNKKHHALAPCTPFPLHSEVGGSEVDPGLYACGWIKRGPTGTIGTNSIDADETVDSIARDAPAPPARPADGAAGLRQLLAARGVDVVDFGGWRRIDAAEVVRGSAVGKPREKFVEVPEMLQAAAAQDG